MSAVLPVFIAGAGPTGLVLALALLKSRIPVRIVDKNKTPHGGARGTAIQPRTLELLAFLGVIDDVFDIATPPMLMAVHSAGAQVLKTMKWAEEAEPSPHIPYPRVASASQAELEKVLRKHIEMLGGRVEYGTEVVDFKQDEHKVTVHLSITMNGSVGHEELVECEYLVAADGAKGHIRKELGLSFLGETKETERMLVANIDGEGVDREHWHMWGSFNTASIGLKPLKPAPLFQVQALGPNLPADLPTTLEAIQDLFSTISGNEDIKLSNAAWVSEWRANIRMVNSFSVGRIFLAGDSAHCHSPAGGQGANTAMQDAFNLAWKLALVIHRFASSALLKTYEIERMPVVAEMLNLSTELHALAFNRKQSSALEIGSTTEAEQVMFRPKRLLQLGVNYRWSPIVVEERTRDGETVSNDSYGQVTTKLRAGDRAPDASQLVESRASNSKTVTLHVTFSSDHHTILIFPATDSDVRIMVAMLEKYMKPGLASINIIIPVAGQPEAHLDGLRTLADTEGFARKGYDVEEGAGDAFVVVRPDGVIGAYTHALSGVDRYFSAVLG